MPRLCYQEEFNVLRNTVSEVKLDNLEILVLPAYTVVCAEYPPFEMAEVTFSTIATK